jgi:dTDP-4-dehydrorhamnose reductase
MIILVGGSGYLGQAFTGALKKRSEPFLSVSRAEVDYTRYDLLVDFLSRTRCSFLINAAGYTGKPNVDACETARAETLQGNTLLPLTLAHACAAVGIPWGHISSGCIYTGAKVFENGRERVEKDLMEPKLKGLREMNPGAVQGFTEADEPNFTFGQPLCSFYSGTKALAEKAILGLGANYIWRLRIPFDEFDNSRNYLSKVQRYPKVYDNVNSLSHRGDLVRACLELWDRRAPFGIYNVTNPGYITTREVVEMIQRILRPARSFEFWAGDEEFYRVAAKTPRSNCVLDVSKLLATGVRMRPIQEAVEAALRGWKKEF